MKIVIEINDTQAGDAVTRRQLADVTRRLESGELGLGEVALSMPFTEYFVTRIAGVILSPGVHGANGTKIVTVAQLEGNAEVEL